MLPFERRENKQKQKKARQISKQLGPQSKQASTDSEAKHHILRTLLTCHMIPTYTKTQAPECKILFDFYILSSALQIVGARYILIE